MGFASRTSLRDWLRAPGSLSRRLAQLGARFSVEVLRQRTAPLNAAERQALGLPRHGGTVVREVLLRVDGRPMVWARSALHGNHLRGPWKAVRGLGSKPLAQLLYDDRGIQRSALRAERLPRHGALCRQIARDWQAATGAPMPASMQWSRASVFTRQGAQLRVMEVFVPELAEVPVPFEAHTRAARVASRRPALRR